MRELVKHLTAQWRDAERVKETDLSENARKFDKLITRLDFGCQERSVRKLVSELIGEKLPNKKRKREPIPLWTCSVVENRSNSHNYAIGSTILTYESDYDGDSHAIKVDGSKGNWIRLKNVRPATDEEIDIFFDTFVSNVIQNGVPDYDEDEDEQDYDEKYEEDEE